MTQIGPVRPAPDATPAQWLLDEHIHWSVLVRYGDPAPMYRDLS